MFRPDPITFHVPASAANLGPGYGMLGVALDLPLHVTIESRTDGVVLIERPDQPLMTAEDRRQDPVLPGLLVGP